MIISLRGLFFLIENLEETTNLSFDNFSNQYKFTVTRSFPVLNLSGENGNILMDLIDTVCYIPKYSFEVFFCSLLFLLACRLIFRHFSKRFLDNMEQKSNKK